MKRKTINISVLVLFHLLIFNIPYTAKALHHAEQPVSYLTGIAIANEDPCPICDFVYGAFNQSTDTLVKSNFNIGLFIPIDSKGAPTSCSIYIKLRAPPEF
ncbi:MAG TPA: hypothetical protein VHI78_01365 [Bacteroidales bacterium]|jgi:hypothetical protein|nr:hypothetical protein [Bacteroidales bacterium]